MNYNEFENLLKERLIKGNGPKLLIKLIDAPFRYFSLLNLFNFLTKLEQSFLRTQENNYYKFLNDLVVYFFISKKFETLENKLKVLTKDEESDVILEHKINLSHLFRDENTKTLFCIWQKKRDYYSNNKAIEIIEKFKSDNYLIKKHFEDYQIKSYLWFVDEEIKTNKHIYIQHLNDDVENRINVVYGSELFDFFEDNEYWKNIQNFQKTFKDKNHDFFLKMPNLDTDKETYEFMIEMSDSLWEKLNLDTEGHKLIREKIFDLRNENSNYLKAFKMRQIKATAVDEDEYKMKKYANENNLEINN